MNSNLIDFPPWRKKLRPASGSRALGKEFVLFAKPCQFLGRVLMRAGQQIGFPVLPLPPRQAGQPDPQIIGNLPNRSATGFCQPNRFFREIFRENPSLSYVLIVT
jgi:hypothetical protein